MLIEFRMINSIILSINLRMGQDLIICMENMENSLAMAFSTNRVIYPTSSSSYQ